MEQQNTENTQTPPQDDEPRELCRLRPGKSHFIRQDGKVVVLRGGQTAMLTRNQAIAFKDKFVRVVDEQPQAEATR